MARKVSLENTRNIGALVRCQDERFGIASEQVLRLVAVLERDA